MTAQPPAVDPARGDAALDDLRRAAATCTGCDLYRNATQTVFGTGDAQADIVLVGEQPGDREDRSGEPFVGPAGQLLDKALADAELDRARVYLTNAVKHFKWTAKGKVRLHKRPSAAEVSACRPWLQAELAVLDPALVVCLGATAAAALLGPAFRVSKDRGRVVDLDGRRALATWHPSAVLRASGEEREHAYDALVGDLRTARLSVVGG